MQGRMCSVACVPVRRRECASLFGCAVAAFSSLELAILARGMVITLDTIETASITGSSNLIPLSPHGCGGGLVIGTPRVIGAVERCEHDRPLENNDSVPGRYLPLHIQGVHEREKVAGKIPGCGYNCNLPKLAGVTVYSKGVYVTSSYVELPREDAAGAAAPLLEMIHLALGYHV